MHNSTQFRWIEQAEARSVREHAILHRAASESHASIAYTRTALGRLDWIRELVRPLGRGIALVQSFLLDRTKLVRTRARAASKLSSAEVDYYHRVLAAVLITDIVDSTKQVAGMGDREWRILLDRHDDATRYQIKRFGGREVGNRGDGFIGMFGSPARAVCCAAAIADTIAPFGITLRSGIHVGEVHLKSKAISGIAVHIAARIAATARPGESLVSKTVRDLVAGSGLVFEDRGIHQLRGLSEEIHLYAMRVVNAPRDTRIIDLPTGLAHERPARADPEHDLNFRRIEPVEPGK
jgi:class 3 adenylate cyclase